MMTVSNILNSSCLNECPDKEGIKTLALALTFTLLGV